jgi:hypothetical protein
MIDGALLLAFVCSVRLHSLAHQNLEHLTLSVLHTRSLSYFVRLSAHKELSYEVRNSIFYLPGSYQRTRYCVVALLSLKTWLGRYIISSTTPNFPGSYQLLKQTVWVLGDRYMTSEGSKDMTNGMRPKPSRRNAAP